MNYNDIREQYLSDMHKIIISNNLKLIDSVICFDSYPPLTQKDKEKELFYMIYLDFIISNTSENVLKYLIFDYQIDKNNASIGALGEMDQRVQRMFDSRSLNTDLNKNLECNNSTTKKHKL